VPWIVRDLTNDDLHWIGWAGGPGHVDSVAAALARVVTGRVDYLAICGPADLPLGIGGIDFDVRPDGGTLWQLAVQPALQSCGLGRALIGAAEERIRGRGLAFTYLSVEEDNLRARSLYERLSYDQVGTEELSWPVQDERDQAATYTATCVVMRKKLWA
jgi:ribosomal protein S18 acetylase RimI-like enzyme